MSEGNKSEVPQELLSSPEKESVNITVSRKNLEKIAELAVKGRVSMNTGDLADDLKEAHTRLFRIQLKIEELLGSSSNKVE